MIKLTKEQLKRLEIYNAWNFAGKGNPYIYYVGADNGRGGRSAHFSVARPGYKTDPNAHFLSNGCKEFCVPNRESKPIAFEEAKQWAGNRYKITEWVKTPFGSWMSKEFVETRLKELKQQLKEKETNEVSGNS